TTPPGRRASRPTRWCGWPRRPLAAREVARTASPRAAAPTPTRHSPRWRRSGASWRAADPVVPATGPGPDPGAGPGAGPGTGAPTGPVSVPPAGARLGVDPGDARIGVAGSDPSGLLATPVETLARGTG